VLWGELTWPEILRLGEEVGLVMWPCGSVEQHGPHLPVTTDTLHAQEAAARASTLTGVPVLPPLLYGDSLVHGRSFPGTISLRSETLIAMAKDVLHWVRHSGFTRMLMLCGHGGNIVPLTVATRAFTLEHPEFLTKVVMWPALGGVEDVMIRDVPDAPEYIHAGWSETSLILAIREDLVHMDLAVDEPERALGFDYAVDRVSLSGVVGRETTSASADAGRDILERGTEGIVAALRVLVDEVPPFAQDTPHERLRAIRARTAGS